jgi:hypothetical protein
MWSVWSLYNEDLLQLRLANVTLGGISCSKGTPSIEKPNPSLFIKGGTMKEEKKQKS